jgi:general secretion pathway protein C
MSRGAPYRLAAAAVIVFLLGTVLVAGARLAWHLDGHTSVLPTPLPAPASTPEQPASRDIGRIIALAPFGSAAAPEPAPDTDAPAARLNVRLRGVLVDPDPAQSRAFLQVANATDVYRIGDPVEAAELVAINADTVTLSTEGGLRVIGFGGELDDDGTPAQAEPEEAPAAQNDPFARLAAAIVPGQGSIDLREAPPPETTEQYIDLWRERITANPQAAMDTVGVELVENGYRIKSDPNIGVTLAGLKPGDVVTRLNGQTVGDLDSDRKLYDEVAASGIARLEVLRDGQALLLTFPLR